MARDKIKEVPPRVLERVLRSLAPFLLSVFLRREGAEEGAGSASFFPASNTIVITRLLASQMLSGTLNSELIVLRSAWAACSASRRCG